MHAPFQRHDTRTFTGNPICIMQTSNAATQHRKASKALDQDTCQRNPEGLCTCGQEIQKMCAPVDMK